MKLYILILLLLIPTFILGNENEISKSVAEKFASHDFSKTKTIHELAVNISKLTEDKREQLQMLLLWTYKNMLVDSIRFSQPGVPLTLEESIKKRIGLCEEFSNIFSSFCREIKLTNIRIEGYVRYLNFNPGDRFEETNHAWNAVYIDSTWLLCDLFWSTNVMKTDSSFHPKFFKNLNTDYFLALPENFITDHLPSDPVFQFDNHPIKIIAFTSSKTGIDSSIERLSYYNYTDSIKVLLKLNQKDRNLKIAQRSYVYNRDNPNILISEYYNRGVLIVNNNSATVSELKKAKKYFTSALILIDKSNNEDIKELKPSCAKGLNRIDRLLLSKKQ